MTPLTRRGVERRLDDLDGGEAETEETTIRILRGDVRERPQSLEDMTHDVVTWPLNQ